MPWLIELAHADGPRWLMAEQEPNAIGFSDARPEAREFVFCRDAIVEQERLSDLLPPHVDIAVVPA